MARSKGLTVGISADLKEFKKGLNDVNKEINKTAKQAEAYKKELSFNYDPNNFINAQKNAQRAIEKTAEKVQTLKNKINEIEQNGGQGGKDWEYLTNELEKTNLKAQQLKRSLNEINQIKAEQLKNTFNNLGDKMQQMGRAIAPLSAISGAALFGLFKVGKGAIETADNLQTLAERVGLSVEKLQEYNYIARQTDVEQSEFNNILKKTNGALASLATGNIDKQAKALQALGITSEQAKKGLSENIDQILNSLTNIKDPMEQLAILNDLVGEKVGQSLVPMLKIGSKNLDTLREEFQGLNYVTNENAEKLANFDNVLNRIKEQFKNLKVALGASLLPVMEKIAETMQEKVVPFFTQLVENFNNLSDKTKTFITLMLGVGTALAPVLLIGGQLIKTMGGVVQGVKMIGLAVSGLQAHPIVLAIAGVIALLVLLITKNEKLREQFLEFIKIIGEAFMPLFEAIRPIFEIIGGLLETVAKTLGDALVPIFEILSKVLKVVLTNNLKPLILYLKMMGKIMQIMEKPLMAIASIIEQILVPAFNALSWVIDGVFTIFNELVATFFDGVSGVVNFIIDMINGVIDTINAINFLGIGGKIENLDRVDISQSLGLRETIKEKETKETKKTTETIKNSTKTIEKATENNTTLTNIYNYNNDNSNKNPTINIKIENYGEKVDIQELTKAINIELAKAM